MNTSLNEEIYNKEIKEDFLNDYPESTQPSYRRIFSYSQPFEKKNKKDLYDFNVSEMKEVLHSMNPTTFGAARTNGRIVSAYIYWSMEKEYKKNEFNPLKSKGPEWFDQFVDEDIFLFISEKELIISIEQRCANAQDAVIFRLLFEGVQGKGCSELTNLRKQDIDFENKLLNLKDADGSLRENFAVSQRCIDYIEKAIDEKEYKKKNNEMSTAASNVRNFTELVQNDYVLRNSITKTNNYLGSVDKHTIYRRIDSICEVLGYQNLNTKNIARSGMLKMANDLKKEHGELGKEQFQLIADRFGVNNLWSFNDFITEENLERLYNNK